MATGRASKTACTASIAAGFVLALLLTDLCAQTPGNAQTPAVDPSANELAGLWRARQAFGSPAHGPLILEKTTDGWLADFLGQRFSVQSSRTELSFELANHEGSFLGRLPQAEETITGHWISARSPVNGTQYATPLVLKVDGANRWRGDITSRDDDFTLYLMMQARPDGTLGAFLRNPERNIGVFLDVDHL